jgi:hypothetical protein
MTQEETEQKEQAKEHRLRLDDYELLFMIECLKEMSKSRKLILGYPSVRDKKKYGDLIIEYRRQIAALDGMARKLESALTGGKKQLREFERYAVFLVVDKKELAKEAQEIPQYPAGRPIGSQHST